MAVVVLKEPLVYDGAETRRIPVTEYRDLGGMFLGDCPDGTHRAFRKSNVVEVEVNADG